MHRLGRLLRCFHNLSLLSKPSLSSCRIEGATASDCKWGYMWVEITLSIHIWSYPRPVLGHKVSFSVSIQQMHMTFPNYLNPSIKKTQSNSKSKSLQKFEGHTISRNVYIQLTAFTPNVQCTAWVDYSGASTTFHYYRNPLFPAAG